MRGRPVDLPEHIDEENIGHLWQSHCRECDAVATFNEQQSDVVGPIKAFRETHRNCASDELRDAVSVLDDVQEIGEQ